MFLPDTYWISPFAHDHGFCESKLLGHPEPFNSLSCLFMIGIAVYGLKRIHNLLPASRELLTSLAINGFCSFWYHFTGMIGWGIADRMSMILIAAYSLDVISALGKKSRPSTIGSTINGSITKNIYLLALMMTCGLHHENLFNMLFGVFLAKVLYETAYACYKLSSVVDPFLIIRAAIGGLSMLSGCVFWIVVETVCEHYPLVGLLQGHALWHVGLSYGAYQLIRASNALLL